MTPEEIALEILPHSFAMTNEPGQSFLKARVRREVAAAIRDAELRGEQRGTSRHKCQQCGTECPDCALFDLRADDGPAVCCGPCAFKIIERSAEARGRSQTFEVAIREALRWRTVIDEALLSLEMTASDDPKESLNRLICWEQKVALDPAVSEAAARLRDETRIAALEEAATMLSHAAMHEPMTADAANWLQRMAQRVRECIAKARGE